MFGPQVLEDYDIVVSIPQHALNAQLAQLAQNGVIPNKLQLMKLEDADGNFTFYPFGSESELPKDAAGNPTCSYIDAAVVPQIEIAQSGEHVTLVLQFTGGRVGFVKGMHLVQHDPTGWRYGVAMNLDLAAVAASDVGTHVAVPPLVQAQLQAFDASMFDVSHLFLDFNSSDLMTADPATTHAPGSDGSDAQPDLTLFMQFYLAQLKASPNGFILGYVPTASARTQVPPTQVVPDQLLPTGTTYVMLANAANPDLSTLNFVLATKGGHGSISGTPSPNDFSPPPAPALSSIESYVRSLKDFGFFPPLDATRALNAGQYDATIAYSHNRLLEDLVLRPIFAQIYGPPYDQIKTAVETQGPGNDYAQARGQQAPGVWTFSIADQNTNSDLYRNYFTVSQQAGPDGVVLAFSGQLYALKEKSENCFFCTAEATSAVTQAWGGSVRLALATGPDGQPALQVTSQFDTPPLQGPDNWHNGCASAMSILGDVIGDIMPLVNIISGDFFSHLFTTVSIDGLGDLGSALKNMSTVVRGVIMLPTGQSLRLGDLGADGAGNLWIGANFAPPAALSAAVPAARETDPVAAEVA